MPDFGQIDLLKEEVADFELFGTVDDWQLRIRDWRYDSTTGKMSARPAP